MPPADVEEKHRRVWLDLQISTSDHTETSLSRAPYPPAPIVTESRLFPWSGTCNRETARFVLSNIAAPIAHSFRFSPRGVKAWDVKECYEPFNNLKG